MLVPRPLHVRDLEPKVRRFVRRPQRFAPAFGQLLTSFALGGYALALWRLGADLDLTGEFFISQGLFSRWQVWLALAIAIQLASRELTRMDRGGTARR
jgi:hypothetical protein